jgi:Sfi1 spindle body protein
MIIRGSQTLPSRASSDVGVRHVMPGLSSSSRPRSVIETSHRRTPTTTQRYSLQRDPEFSISFEEDPRKYTILRQFWHVWRAKTIRRHSRLSSQTELADRHYRQMLVPLAFETWKQKWRYFAVLCRRVELDRTKTILARCLTWWRYATRLEIQRNERIHNEVVLRRMFKGWLREIREKREEMNSVTLQHVMERWKAKASTTRDLHAMSETYNRRRILRQFWKEWFFRTCAVKTVQYYQIKLKQHTIGKWIRRARHIRVLNRHAKYIARNKVITHTWDRWRSALDSRLSDGDLADNHFKQNSLFAAINSWKKTLQLSLRAGLFTARTNNKLLAHAWTRWRDITYV